MSRKASFAYNKVLSTTSEYHTHRKNSIPLKGTSPTASASKRVGDAYNNPALILSDEESVFTRF